MTSRSTLWRRCRPVSPGLVLLALTLAVTVACTAGGPEGRVVIDSLSQPRGLSVGSRGVCVAEAGSVDPVEADSEGAATIEADTGRLMCSASPDTDPEVVLDELPFVYYPDAAVTSGASDVIQHDGKLYALIGESSGDWARRVLSVGPEGTEVIADLLAFAQRHQMIEGALRSNPYAFVPAPDGDGFFVTEAAAGTVLRVDLDGTVETFATVPGHEVLTGLAWGPDGRLYVASFGQLPHPDGSGAVVAVDGDGDSSTVIDGLTMVIDVGFDDDGAMYILEYASPPDTPDGTDAYRDGTGRLLHVGDLFSAAAPQVMLDDLDRPTALDITDDALLISLSVGELAAGAGSVVRYRLVDLEAWVTPVPGS